MKIRELRLTNIRCFKELSLKLNGESALLVGDNGDGKSTVLRSLAMGLCDDSSASALFRDLYGESVRKGSAKGTIKVELEDSSARYKTETTIATLKAFERVDQTLYRLQDGKQKEKLEQNSFPWDKVFAAGYGPGVRVRGTADYDYYLAVDALYPLFVYDKPLQNPELVIRRLVAPDGKLRNEKKVLGAVRTLLQCILQLESSDSIRLTRTGIEVNTGQGFHPLSSLGDGYQSMVTCVLDLLSWWYLRDPPDLTEISGIVLIDELEQHLHPRWQRNILQLLTQSFPKVQFIATTHSPLVASGCENIPVHRLNDGEHETVKPFGWRAEEVYEMMGLPTSRAESFVELLEEYQRMDDKRLRGGEFSPPEKKRFKFLREQLEMTPGTDPIKLATELENLVRRAQESSNKNP